MKLTAHKVIFKCTFTKKRRFRQMLTRTKQAEIFLGTLSTSNNMDCQSFIVQFNQ